MVPALNSRKSSLIMVWREAGDSHLVWSRYSGGQWSSPLVLDDRRTGTSPAIA
ncbi:hypothetical protein AB0B66_24950 [Catellatospora sp. NPDC049111]|jgi:hypothetical protein